MKRTSQFLGVAYIVFMMALAWKDVGTQACKEPYIFEWYLPLLIEAVVITPFVLGYLSGKEAG